MDFKKTLIYQEIIGSDKTFSVPFHTKSGIIINENNVDYIIEIEIKKAKAKLEVVNDVAYIFNNIEEKIINQYKSNINKPYLVLEFAYLNNLNVEDAVKNIEASTNFYEWLVE